MRFPRVVVNRKAQSNWESGEYPNLLFCHIATVVSSDFSFFPLWTEGQGLGRVIIAQ